ncbi:hypothetical protein BRADI_1g56086v3 [Brachypodium distachyon]|uniref:Uncharacterized protein n=1 Tax=Brachypodium distachyon TaxID=15368 RepID=A0A0Q3HCS1_BRADI|nr:hypothetical protein BRADI_1g56086v3 [Brachypodium distachyon]KQK20695.1 hypothetical protein BRADI_1g56086v3 [Brachypodium distachyon]PNT76954.1 hypothetical protein BRADI_1g56086v3 [Brachypodium distachyon]PNT76955.1 hypothetical protein BRADI_1g56086v3 [Brachypodium distachyon]
MGGVRRRRTRRFAAAGVYLLPLRPSSATPSPTQIPASVFAGASRPGCKSHSYRRRQARQAPFSSTRFFVYLAGLACIGDKRAQPGLKRLPVYILTSMWLFIVSMRQR